ncbi:MAG: MarR family transcriptional regulator [Chloroflexota bacterium]|nr:MarR family transcriptional regulator [Chloroflexota bacterium]
MMALREGGFLISKIHHLSGRVFAKKLKEYQVEINPAQGRIMFVLWQEDGISIGELAKKTSLGKSTLTSMLDRLEGMGYVTRVRSEDDRRSVLIRLTEKDESWQEVYAQVSQDMGRLYYDGFSEGEIDEFEQYLRRILDNLVAIEAGVE